ncbi:MAG: SEC-C metal-binding domain-containing protein [Vicinamibacterales bacterium]
MIPAGAMALRVEGEFRFCANGKTTEVIEDSYEVRIEVPPNFPKRMALVWETGGRIRPNYHRLDNGALCLGSRLGVRLQMGRSVSILRFVERCLIPYLYGYSYAEKHGAPPFGELEHGERGSLQELASLLCIQDLHLALALSFPAATKRRRANRRLCPCGSGRRLGRCHNRKVNALRRRVGRLVLASEMRVIAQAFSEQSPRKRSVVEPETGVAKASLLQMSREAGGQATIPAWVHRGGRALCQQPVQGFATEEVVRLA